MATHNRQGERLFSHIKELREAADDAWANSRAVHLARAKQAVLGAKAGLGYLEELINTIDRLPDGERERALECLWHGMQAILVIGSYCSKMPGVEKRGQVDQAAHARWGKANSKRQRDTLIDKAILEGGPITEIAARAGVSVSTVKRRLSTRKRAHS